MGILLSISTLIQIIFYLNCVVIIEIIQIQIVSILFNTTFNKCYV